MTYGFNEIENLAQSQDKEQVKALFEQYKKEPKHSATSASAKGSLIFIFDSPCLMGQWFLVQSSIFN